MRRRFLDRGRDTCFFLAFDLLLAGGSVGTEAGWRGASSPCSGDGMASTETGTSTSEDTSGTSGGGGKWFILVLLNFFFFGWD